MKGRVTFNLVKKALLTAVVSVGLFSGSAQAQQLHLGPSLGPQLTNMQSDLGKFKGLVGFNGGLSGDLRFGNFAIGLDALYSQNGATKDIVQYIQGYDRVNYFQYKTTDKFTYLQFHLLGKFLVPLGAKPVIPYDKPGDQKMFLSFFAGPYYAQRLSFSSTGKTSYWTIMDNGDTVNSVSNANFPGPNQSASANSKLIANNDIGITAGAGINFNLNGGKTILGFEGRYSQSLLGLDLGYYKNVNFNREKSSQSNQYAQIYNTAMAFNVSLKFRIFGD